MQAVMQWQCGLKPLATAKTAGETARLQAQAGALQKSLKQTVQDIALYLRLEWIAAVMQWQSGIKAMARGTTSGLTAIQQAQAGAQQSSLKQTIQVMPTMLRLE